MPEIEFGSKTAADRAREEHEDHLCVDDDRRLKTVTFTSDLPEATEEQLRAGARTGRVEGEGGAGIVQLSDAEKRKVGPFTEPNNYGKAAAVKGLLTANGVSDWTAWYDPTLTVDEHRSSVLPQARQSGGGARSDSEEAQHQREQRARQVEKGVGGRCDHAHDHCEHGEPEACEFLTEVCGYDEHDVSLMLKPDTDAAEYEQQNLVTVGGGDFPEMDVTPQVAGALHRSWQGYKAGVSSLDRLLGEDREEVINARQAMAAINRIRTEHDQDELHPDRLHDLLEALESMPGEIPQVRTLDHWADVDGDGEAEPVIEEDPQRDLSGERVNPQARLAGGQTGEVESQVEQAAQVERNEGGLTADTREGGEAPTEENTETEIPGEFRVAEGGQETL